MRATCQSPHDSKSPHHQDDPKGLIKHPALTESDGGDFDEEGALSDTNLRGGLNPLNKDTFLATHMNHDLLLAINWTGLSFYENSKRDKII